MRGRIELLLFFIVVFSSVTANMASPFREGSLSGSAISSKEISILYEKIVISIQDDFKTAHYQVEYKIYNQNDSVELPLLFLALDYHNNFNVTVDGKTVDVSDGYLGYDRDFVINSFNLPGEESLMDADFLFKWDSWGDSDAYSTEHYLGELRYFEAVMGRGEHTVFVEYDANVWIDKSGVLNKYSFRYSLYPAKFWSSFGGIEIVVVQQDSQRSLTYNLTQEPYERTDDRISWNFEEIPGDVLIISWEPVLTRWQHFLTAMTPFGFTLFLLPFLLLFFVRHVTRQRLKKPNVKLLPSVLFGTVLIPLFMWVVFVASNLLVTELMGEHVVNKSGYLVYAIMIFIPFYLLTALFSFFILFTIDLVTKKKHAVR